MARNSGTPDLVVRVLEIDDVVRLLRSEVDRAGGQVAWAKEVGVDRVLVNRILNDQRPPTKSIINALNLRIVFLPRSGSKLEGKDHCTVKLPPIKPNAAQAKKRRDT